MFTVHDPTPSDVKATVALEPELNAPAHAYSG